MQQITEENVTNQSDEIDKVEMEGDTEERMEKQRPCGMKCDRTPSRSRKSGTRAEETGSGKREVSTSVVKATATVVGVCQATPVALAEARRAAPNAGFVHSHTLSTTKRLPRPPQTLPVLRQTDRCRWRFLYAYAT